MFTSLFEYDNVYIFVYFCSVVQSLSQGFFLASLKGHHIFHTDIGNGPN